MGTKFRLETRSGVVASYGATYDGYLQYCDDMGNEPYGEDSVEFCEWMEAARRDGGCCVG